MAYHVPCSLMWQCEMLCRALETASQHRSCMHRWKRSALQSWTSCMLLLTTCASCLLIGTDRHMLAQCMSQYLCIARPRLHLQGLQMLCTLCSFGHGMHMQITSCSSFPHTVQPRMNPQRRGSPKTHVLPLLALHCIIFACSACQQRMHVLHMQLCVRRH